MNEGDVRDEVLDWFHGAWDPDLSLVEWRSRLLDAGWAVPSWPAEWFGRGLPAWSHQVAHAAIRDAGGVAVPLGAGMALAAPTIHEHGSDDLKRRLLRPAITGESTWCQLFSEPGAGSDLAGLKATAVRDGDHWLVNGQKVWNTSADHADLAILVARTDWDVPKHAGITYFVLDMRQDGVEVRPIRQMNHHASFNEVFLDEAVIPHADVVGAVGDGWRVARATLAHERTFSGQRRVHIEPTAAGRVIVEARAEAAEYLKTYEWYPQRQGRFDLLLDRARSAGTAHDPVLRDEIMRVWTFQWAAARTAERAKVQRALGRPPGPEGSIGKLALSEVARRCNHVHGRIAGAEALLAGGDDPDQAAVAETLISTPAQSIAGGTDEVQKNILGESMLGLPKEPSVDRGVPYRQVGRPGE
ncbi:MAG: acyl-CoA dehydrogenase family protein [Actinomycetota bacterium]